MTDTPGIRRPRKPCARCNTPIEANQRHCPACSRTHNQQHNAKRTAYHTPTWSKQRARIISRDGDQCVLCGSSERLHVHHLDHDASPSAVTPDHRLVTLCATHHAQLEWEYQTGMAWCGTIHAALSDHLRDSPRH